jgi:Mrp family chromosome partitioning ATPase
VVAHAGQQQAGGTGGTEDSIGKEHPAISKVNLDFIRHTIVVLSGKGGVGKSTVAVNLAVSLSRRGRRVGLMDIDIHGPSVPGMLGLEGKRIPSGNSGRLTPVPWGDNLNVLSTGFLLNNPDDAVIWRGPKKLGAIRQFLTMADWGDLDFLIVDSPPGTGDEPLSVCQLIGNADGALIVTTRRRMSPSKTSENRSASAAGSAFRL